MADYSVLMSVYKNEKPEYLKTAIESMLEQSVATNDFVLVCDGPLTDSLDEVITHFVNTNPGLFNVVKLPENVGLAMALNEGIKYCKNEIVARMDSDDFSKPNRIETQLKAMDETGADIVGTNVFEFVGDITRLTGERSLPEYDEEIREFAKSRSPFNHPSVIFKKSAFVFNSLSLYQPAKAYPSLVGMGGSLPLSNASKSIFHNNLFLS